MNDKAQMTKEVSRAFASVYLYMGLHPGFGFSNEKG